MLLLILFQYFSKADSPKSHGQNLLRRLQVKLHRCHSRLSGIFLKNQKDCGQAAMTESDNDVALLMNSLVSVMLNLIQHLMEKDMRPCSPRCLLGDPPHAGIRLSAENKFRVTHIAVLFNKHYSMKTFKMCIARYDFTIFLQC